MKKGTLLCKLFGHKFHAEHIEYTPHYLKMVEQGMAHMLMPDDFIRVGHVTDYCVRCGLREAK